MPILQIPVSNSLTQAINPWNWFLNVQGCPQFGLININLGKSSDPALEQTILAEVGTYGRQLGRLGEALEVLLSHVKPENLKPEERPKAGQSRPSPVGNQQSGKATFAGERKAITAFIYQQDEIASVKARPRERPAARLRANTRHRPAGAACHAGSQAARVRRTLVGCSATRRHHGL